MPGSVARGTPCICVTGGYSSAADSIAHPQQLHLRYEVKSPAVGHMAETPMIWYVPMLLYMA